MPLSTLRPELTGRFREVDLYLSGIAARESSDPRIPDEIEVRVMRGLFFVHLYAAFEYAMDQSFIRLAQIISKENIILRHMEPILSSVALDPLFKSLSDTADWRKKFAKRFEFVRSLQTQGIASIADNVLSDGMQSATTRVISTAFEAYGVNHSPFIDPTVRGYIDEVVERRHAVAHGRESPATVGVMRTIDLRIRYGALYQQSVYVLDTLNEFIASKRYIAARHRSRYRNDASGAVG